MVMMLKTTTRWEGFVGAPGYTNFYFAVTDPIQQAVDDAKASAAAFFVPLAQRLPFSVALVTSPLVELVNSTNGQLQSVETATTGEGRTLGTDAGVYSAPSGGVVTWLTAGVHRGHRVRGRTFIVPLAAGSYESNGTLNQPAITSLQDAGGALLVGASIPGIWARPHRSKTVPPVVTPDGDFFPITGVRITDKAAILRSRRD